MRPRELAALLDEVCEVDLRHPGWWLLLGVTAAFEPGDAAEDPGAIYAAFLGANGGPRSDTFMARALADAPTTLAHALAGAVLRASAAAATLHALDGQFPAQPLTCTLARERGWLVRRSVDQPAAVFVLGERAWLAPLTAGCEPALVRALAAAVLASPGSAPAPLHELAPHRPRVAAPALVVSALDAATTLTDARHLHRRAWTSAGGPWLGVGVAHHGGRPHELVTTCHFAIDGYAHARVTDELFRRTDARASELPALVLAAREALGASAEQPLPIHWAPSSEPLGFAARDVAARLDFHRAAWAMGRLLDARYPGRDARRFSPTFQVPIAPGAADDPQRRLRRVLFGLLSLPRRDGACLGPDEFRTHARRLLAREATAEGFLSRLARALLAAPLPDPVRRRLIAGDARPHPRLPMIEALAGRGCLSLLRFPPEELPAQPLLAASSPGLSATAADPKGGVVLTLLQHTGGFTASLCGSGLAASPALAEAMLDDWLTLHG